MRLLITVCKLCALLQFCILGLADAAEKSTVTIAVGGKASLYYLPLTLAEQLGYFRAEGIAVDIVDFPGGAKALQAVMGGSADVVSGGFDHTIVMQARGQRLQAFVVQGATPAISLGIAAARASKYRSPADLKGMNIGVTAPGSSTHLFVNHLLASAGLAPDDVAIIGVGAGPGAVAAMRAGQLDAIANIEPTITMLERQGAIRVVVETNTAAGAQAVFGNATLPSGCLYAREAFIAAHPKMVQALTSAMLRALRWMQRATPEQIAGAVPTEYLLGDRALYLAALEKTRRSYSVDGLISPAGVEAWYRILRTHEPAVQRATRLDLAATYDNRFVRAARVK